MVPLRKTGKASKQSPTKNYANIKKDDEDVKIQQKRRRLEDMMGSQWSDTELQRFYEAYRKYGTNWKKVAAAVHSRSVEMVEALYSLNMAYLNLPEGTASVAGLVAMVTDHYCVMEKSNSEQESNEARDQGAPQRARKRRRRKYRNNSFKDIDQNLSNRSPSQCVGSNADCLSLLKANLPEGEIRVVGKRTPRVPVAHSSDKYLRGKYVSRMPDQKLKIDADDHVAHEIALALTKASQRDKTPRVTHSSIVSHRKSRNVSSPVANNNRMRFTQGIKSAQLQGSVRDEQDHEVDNLGRGRTVRDRECFDTVDSQVWEKRLYGKKATTETGNFYLDDMKEAYSGTEEHKSSFVNKKLKLENPKQLLPKGLKKRNKKILFDEDESDAFEALNTLADLSLAMPEPYIDNDYRGADINTYIGKRKGKHSFNGGAADKCDSSDKGRNVGSVPEAEDDSGVRKRKSSPYCMDNSKLEPRKVDFDFQFKLSKNEACIGSDTEEVTKSMRRGKDYHKEGEHVHKSTPLVSCESEGVFPTKTRNRRKRDLPKSSNHKYTNPHVQVESSRSIDGTLNVKEKLANCLSWRKAQRWCIFEWFYSAIDYPWFARREFVEYLDYVGLGHIPRLTRVEWGVIRSSLGKPRRFSQQFLKEEKEKLNQYRESVRNHYADLRFGAKEGLPTDLARPLSVGQQVIAIHPKTREIHDGSVLTVDHRRCRVQFDKPELGVEFVMDIDCMPLNPLENMPASLAVNKLSENHHGIKLNGLASHNSSVQPITNGNIDNTNGPPLRPLAVQDDIASASVQQNVRSSDPTNKHQPVTDQPSFLAQANDADVKSIYEMTCALDEKEAIVSEFKRMNDEVEENQRKNSSFEVPEHFSKICASTIVQLDEVKDQVTSALHCLRQRNTYQGNFGHTTVKPALGDIGSLTSALKSSTFDTFKHETHVTEIADGSRSKAKRMVNVAMQAISSLSNTKNGGFEEAIDFLNSRLSQEDFCTSTPDKQTACTSSAAFKYDNTPESNVQIPSELISNCVAALFMIQKCTEREFPPSDVAQILDSAVTSLQPCSSQNLPIYSEIQKCMGIIRSQILALIRV